MGRMPTLLDRNPDRQKVERNPRSSHLAALAIERGLVLHTTDADFSRFPGLKWKNPLL